MRSMPDWKGSGIVWFQRPKGKKSLVELFAPPRGSIWNLAAILTRRVARPKRSLAAWKERLAPPRRAPKESLRSQVNAKMAMELAELRTVADRAGEKLQTRVPAKLRSKITRRNCDQCRAPISRDRL